MTETQKAGFPLSWEWRGAGFRTDGFVIPAQAGIQTFNAKAIYREWLKLKKLDSHFRGNDGM